METRRTLSLRKHYDAEIDRWITSLRDDISKAESAASHVKMGNFKNELIFNF